MARTRFVTIRKFAELAGYTEDAVRAKISRGDWLKDAIWVKAPDGRILIDLDGYEAWVVSTTIAEQLRFDGRTRRPMR